jgi:hypothetical protein
MELLAKNIQRVIEFTEIDHTDGDDSVLSVSDIGIATTKASTTRIESTSTTTTTTEAELLSIFYQ